MKVVEGQMALLQMASEMSKSDNSMNAQLLREFVSIQSKSQEIWPDVLPDHINVRNTVDQETGKLVSEVG